MPPMKCPRRFVQGAVLAAGVLAAVLAASTGAQTGPGRFKCRPPGSPTPQYFGQLPSECSTVDVFELNQDGSLRRVIPAPRTEEQKRDEARKARERAACIEANKAQNQRDNGLLEAYPTEDDLLAARDRELAKEKLRLEAQARSIEGLHLNRKALDSEAEFYAKHQMPEALRDRLADNDAALARAESAKERIFAELGRIASKFDSDLKRYRELVEHTAAPPRDCEPRSATNGRHDVP